ncbi:hypothetical protein SRHO_G00234660 [Serrasalmus rhombeus]
MLDTFPPRYFSTKEAKHAEKTTLFIELVLAHYDVKPRTDVGAGNAGVRTAGVSLCSAVTGTDVKLAAGVRGAGGKSVIRVRIPAESETLQRRESVCESTWSKVQEELRSALHKALQY